MDIRTTWIPDPVGMTRGHGEGGDAEKFVFLAWANHKISGLKNAAL